MCCSAQPLADHLPGLPKSRLPSCSFWICIQMKSSSRKQQGSLKREKQRDFTRQQPAPWGTTKEEKRELATALADTKGLLRTKRPASHLLRTAASPPGISPWGLSGCFPPSPNSRRLEILSLSPCSHSLRALPAGRLEELEHPLWTESSWRAGITWESLGNF